MQITIHDFVRGAIDDSDVLKDVYLALAVDIFSHHDEVAPIEGEPLESLAQRIAEASYWEHEKYPFVIGAEHKDMGWKDIQTNVHGRIEIRLPKWHKGPVAEALIEIGMEETCNQNGYWCFPEGTSMEIAKELIHPVLQPGTRFTPEETLAKELRFATKHSSINQMALF